MKKFRARRRAWRWPGDERIAFTIGLAFEAFESRSQYVTRETPGQANRLSLSYAEYGPKVGGWRLLELLDRYGIKAHLATNGLAAERYPEFLKTAAADGHEIAGHGWANDRQSMHMDIDQEREDIERTAKAIAAVIGQRPMGWTSPGATPSSNTMALLAEAGYGWSGDDLSDDVPFVKMFGDRPLVVLPHTHTHQNDVQLYLGPRNAPSVIWEGFKESFDQLYREGAEGNPGWVEIILHCQIGGRPVPSGTIRKCLDYVRAHDQVWYTSRNQIANWTLERHARGELDNPS